MQSHKGFRLKKIVQEKFKKSKDFAELMEWTPQTLQYYFNAEDIPAKTLNRVLEVLKMSFQEFIGLDNGQNLMQEDQAGYGQKELIKDLRKQLEDCNKKNMELLQQIVDLQKSVISEQSSRSKKGAI